MATYTEAGRNQKYKEALIKDKRMVELLDGNGNKFINVEVDRTTKYEILGYITNDSNRQPTHFFRI